jgi:large subunit ribosomal protein L4
MKAVVYNKEGKEVETIVLPEKIFGVEVNPDLVHQVVVSQMANRRIPIAHTKDRGEVSGGGKKPWRQKGTGRARHGSIRSPLWKGGGVTFGPRKEKVFEKRIPKKMARKALFMVLSAKAKNNLLVILDELKLDTYKTKQMVSLINKLPLSKKEDKKNKKKNKISALILLPTMDKKAILASRNIEGVSSMQAKDINALDLLSFKHIIMPKESIKVIEETFLKK